MTAVRIAPSDLTWLNMDRPTNLMVVNGLMWFDEEPDWVKVRETIEERLVTRYDVLRARPVRDGRKWMWVQDEEFSLDRQIRSVTLPEPGDRAAMEAYVSERTSEPLDRSRPLWEMDFVSGYVREDGAQGAAVLARFHHALADGIRIVQLVMGLCDLPEDAMPPKVGRRSSGQHPIAKAADTGKRVAGELASFAGDIAKGAVNAVPGLASAAKDLPHQLFHDGVGLVSRPIQVTDAISGLADTDNLSANTWRSVSRLTLWGSENRVVADLAPDVAKRVSWISDLSLDDVKATGRREGATVNDVLMGAVSLGLTRYLAERGRTEVDGADFLVPVALKPIDASLPAELGNHFAMVMFPMPLGITDVGALLPEVHTRMARLKNSAEAMVIYGVQRAVAEAPTQVAEWLTEMVANKTVGLLTNVPGPTAPLSLAGTEVAGILGFVPTAADQSLGLCILSYNGKVSVGVSSDAAILPDPDHLAELIVEALDEMLEG